jgi:hypothetical protein
VDPFLIFGGVVVAGAGAGVYALTVRDLIRRGRLHRQKERLLREGGPPALAGQRVPCPECAEAILPQGTQVPVLSVLRLGACVAEPRR